MTWNLLHVARMLRHDGGIPAHGNQRVIWDNEYEAHRDNPSIAEAGRANSFASPLQRARTASGPAEVGPTGWRSASRWGEGAAVVLLPAVIVAGGFALQAASRDVTARGTDEHGEALNRLHADRAVRERRARAPVSELRPAAAEDRVRSAQPRERPLRRGSGYSSRAGSRRVRRLQRALRRLDLVPRLVLSPGGQPVRLVETGQFGAATERGVRRFQERAGLPVTGVADAKTLDRLYRTARGHRRDQ